MESVRAGAVISNNNGAELCCRRCEARHPHGLYLADRYKLRTCLCPIPPLGARTRRALGCLSLSLSLSLVGRNARRSNVPVGIERDTPQELSMRRAAYTAGQPCMWSLNPE